MNFVDLRKLVRKGEGANLEFKRKATHPDKIAREIVAFANSQGGTLLVGVDDDGQIYGSKFPEEEIYVIRSFIRKYCYPRIAYHIDRIPVAGQREVVAIQVKESRRKPVSIRTGSRRNRSNQVLVRVNDMSVVASQEMIEVLRQQRNRSGVAIEYGETERKVLQQLERFPHLTFEDSLQLLQIPARKVSQTLVQLVIAGLLHIHPTEKGDIYTLVEEAFR